MPTYYKIIKTDIDIPNLVNRLDTLYPLDTYDLDQSQVSDYTSFPLSPTYHKNILDLPTDIKNIFEKYVNCTFMDYFFLWDWRNSTTVLEPHTDPVKKQSFDNVTARICAFINLEGDFNLRFHDTAGKVFDEVVYNTGDIIVLNNTQISHSGNLLSKGNKRAITGYPNIPQNQIEQKDIPVISIDEVCSV